MSLTELLLATLDTGAHMHACALWQVTFSLSLEERFFGTAGARAEAWQDPSKNAQAEAQIRQVQDPRSSGCALQS